MRLGRQLGFLFGLLFCPLSYAQEPESPTVAAAKKAAAFPNDWFGEWKGEVQNRTPNGKQDTFQMELRIAPTDTKDRFQWTIIYNGPQGKSERLYSLVAKDPANGHFAIDENNGIVLDATLIGDTLTEHFTVGGQRLWTTSRLVNSSSGKEIHFELSSADDTQSNLSGGQNGTPEVRSLRIGSQQRAILKPVESADSVKPTQNNAQTSSWKKLETEAYRGKQDDIYFVNERLGWYVNGAGKIFKTTDAGATWTMQLHKPGTYFRCIAFIDEMRGFAGNIGPGYFPGVTDEVPLYETTDGGTTWSAVTNIDGPPVVGLCAMQVLREKFINAGNLDTRIRIIAVGRVGGPTAMLYSDDLGKSWQQVDIHDKAAMAFDVHFFNRNEGIIAAASSTDVAKSNAMIIATSDGGKTWTNAWQSTRPFELTWKIAFPNRDVGYVTIQSYNSDPSIAERFVAKTTDGGKTWSEIPLVSDPKVREFGVGFLDAQTGWVGAVPHGFETKDGGATWQAVDMGNAVNKIRIVETETTQVGYAIGTNVYRIEIPKPPK
jgi:photosystem II stability/assembly factor-like uncharacterized protein